MDKKEFFQGAVTVRSLPEYQWPLSAPIIDGGSVEMPAGRLTQVLNGPTLRFLAIVEFRDQQPRGGHYHPARDEHFYVLDGLIDVRVTNRETKETINVRLTRGDIIHISAGYPHIYVSRGPATALECSDQPFSMDGTVPFTFEP